MTNEITEDESKVWQKYHPEGFLKYLETTLRKPVMMGKLKTKNPFLTDILMEAPIFVKGIIGIKDLSSRTSLREKPRGWGLLGRYTISHYPNGYQLVNQSIPTNYTKMIIYSGCDPLRIRKDEQGFDDDYCIEVAEHHGKLKLLMSPDDLEGDKTALAFPGIPNKPCKRLKVTGDADINIGEWGIKTLKRLDIEWSRNQDGAHGFC